MPQHGLGVSYAKIIPRTHLLIHRVTNTKQLQYVEGQFPKNGVINSHTYILSRVAKLLIGYLIVNYY